MIGKLKESRQKFLETLNSSSALPFCPFEMPWSKTASLELELELELALEQFWSARQSWWACSTFTSSFTCEELLWSPSALIRIIGVYHLCLYVLRFSPGRILSSLPLVIWLFLSVLVAFDLYLSALLIIFKYCPILKLKLWSSKYFSTGHN